ncbi:ArsR/SmtB family transcription factor [Risungbinella massiliensis]|uniref:ArsR/SmtB family transcription factor n=1 Tax=Risungbinella massiliensis TaxID=1329796 RepID=UPI0005CB997C|nr:metalloregulator ArsR/SmtB family transcription factor [Risungbinella massiliensis]
MDHVEIFKALSNRTRLQILQWLKEPEVHFSSQESGDYQKIGVCVGHIQKKAGLSQSTVSQYLAMLQRVGLVTATRVGQWTHYKRNEEAIRQIVDSIKHEL